MYYDHSYFYTQISEEEYQKRVLDAKKNVRCNTVRHVLSIYKGKAGTLKIDRSRFHISVKDGKDYLVRKTFTLSNYDLQVKYYMETTIVKGYEANDVIYNKIAGIGCFVMQRDNYMKADGTFFHASEVYGNRVWHDDPKVIQQKFIQYDINWKNVAYTINEKDFIEGKVKF